jgi:hypothetical protein
MPSERCAPPQQSPERSVRPGRPSSDQRVRLRLSCAERMSLASSNDFATHEPPAARPLARPRLARLVGRRASVPHPVFVLTHHMRPSFTLGDTTFHFVDADPASVLNRARDAAQGKDVRLGGGATTIRPDRDSGNHPMSCLTSSTSRSCPARTA